MAALGGGDGRLELDELGSVIDDATVLARAETLEDPHGSPTLAERLEAAGVLPWARRHRVVVGAAAVVAAAATGLVVVRAWTAPPPPEPGIVAEVTDPVGSLRGSGAPGEVLLATYAVTGTLPGETVAIVGVSGPGLRAGTTEPSTSTRAGETPRTEVGAVVDCSDRAALTAEADQYSLLLARTDRWGRTATQPRPVPAVGASWASAVRQACWPEAALDLLTIDAVSARADRVRGAVTVVMRVSSLLPSDVRIGTVRTDDGTIAVGRTFGQRLAVGGSAELEVLLELRTCQDPRVPRWAWTSPWGYAPADPGLIFAITDEAGDETVTAGLPFAPMQAATIQRAIDRVCAGVPAVDVALEDVGTPREIADGSLLVPVVLRTDVDGGAARTVEIMRDDLTSEPSITRPGRDGLARQVWPVLCVSPTPMRVRLEVEAGGRAYPWQWISTDARLADAVMAGCPGVTRETLSSYGWPWTG